MKDIYESMASQNILTFYGSKLDLKVDNSELYDYEISKTWSDYTSDVLDFNNSINYDSLIIDTSLANFSSTRNTITLIEYDNRINDSDYVYSGMSITLNYQNFVGYFGSPYSHTILNNDIYTYTGITGEVHYFKISGFNNELDSVLLPDPTPTPTPTHTTTPTNTTTPTPTHTTTSTPTPSHTPPSSGFATGPFNFDFDYMVVEYFFTDGTDMDTMAYLTNPAIMNNDFGNALPGDYVGTCAQSSNGPQFPSINPYLVYGGDNRDSSGTEAVLFNLVEFKNQRASDYNIEIAFTATWYGNPGQNPVIMRATMWKGGTPEPDGYTFINTGATATRMVQSDGYVITSNTQNCEAFEEVAKFVFDTQTFDGYFINPGQGITPTPTPTHTTTPTNTSTPTNTPTPSITPSITPSRLNPPNISYSQSTYTFTYAIFSRINIPAPVNTGGLVTSYSIDVPTYPGLYFGIDNNGAISFETRMSPGQFDIYVTATNNSGDDIKRIRIILTQ